MSQPIIPTEIRTVYEGRIFTLRIETVPLPKGGVLRAEIVRHPGSVVIIPIDDAGDIILVRQYRPAIGRHAWELPAGSLKPGEDPAAAALRECHEEIGLVPSALQPLGAFFPTPGYCDEEMRFFRASGLRQPRAGESAQPDEDEDIEAQAFSTAAIREMVAAGEIIDLKTVAALSLLAPA
ncbi:MAG: NUDIX hydrolase [Vicinamibacterales bacterium]